ncbi:MAG: NUDIX domain-containing protein [Armatimonadota bacterium]
MVLEERVTNSRYVYRGRVVSLRLDDVETARGKRSIREVVEHRGAVAVVPLLADGRVVMVRQFRLPASGVLLEIPAGTLEPQEDPAVCAERELREETGYAAGKLTPLFRSFLAPGYSSELLHTFLAEDLKKVGGEADADEVLELEMVPIADALSRIHSGEICDAKTICGLLMVARVLGV